MKYDTGGVAVEEFIGLRQRCIATLWMKIVSIKSKWYE